MSANHAPVLTAIAFQLSAALETYQMHVEALSDPWSQRREYERVSGVFDEIRMLKGALPELSVHMVEVLICHVELMKSLWLHGTNRQAVDHSALEALRSKHRDAVSTMRSRCLRFFSRD